MKRAIALILCLVFAVATFTSCGDSSDKGAIINMYIGSEIRNLDPATAYTNADSIKILGLLYEGLMKIGSDGKLKKALAKSYEFNESTNTLSFELNTTAWSDSTQVTAENFVFAFQRILEPDFSSEAAVLLYPIKNARAVKAGDASLDSLGVTAPDTTLLEIVLEEGANYNEFLENLASPALVPLREDKVKKPLVDEESGQVQRDEYGDLIYDGTWATKSTMSVSNGPFALKTMDESTDMEYVLERNKYYYLDKESDDLDKFVKPYRIVIKYDRYAGGDTDAIVEDYDNKELFYTSLLPADKIESYGKKVKFTNLFSTNSYIFDPDNALLAIPEVRKALSMALDRNEIAKLSGDIYLAATGLVPTAVYNTKYGTSFRTEQGDAISATADIDGAKNLLKNVTFPEGNKSFTLTYRTFLATDFEEKVAEYAKEQWEKLGFKVTLKPLGFNRFNTALTTGDYDVIAYDYQTNSTSALSSLAPFALEFSGAAKDIIHNNFDHKPGRTGYNSDAYNKLIDEAYALAPYSDERAAKLFEAEKLLMQDSPIIPLVYYRDYYISQDLSDISSSIYGFRYFNKTSLKNYKDHLPVEETSAK